MTSLLLTASLATALVYGLGGAQAARGALMVGTVVALTAYLSRLYGPAHRPLQRAGGHHDRAGQLRPRLRGARPAADDRGEARRRGHPARARPPSSSTTSTSATRPPRRCRWRHSRRSRCWSAPTTSRCSSTSTSRPSPASWSRWSGPSGAGKTTLSHLVPRLYDVRAGAVRINGIDVRDATLASIARHGRRGHPGRAPLPRDDPRQPALRQARRHRRRALRGAARGPDPAAGRVPARRPRHPGGRPRLPALRRREAAHRHRPAAPQGARHRRARRGHRAPRLRVRGRCAGGAPPCAHRAHLAGDRPPALDGARRRRHPGARRRRIVERGTHAQPARTGGLYAELYRTQFESQARGDAEAEPARRPRPRRSESRPAPTVSGRRRPPLVVRTGSWGAAARTPSGRRGRSRPSRRTARHGRHGRSRRR